LNKSKQNRKVFLLYHLPYRQLEGALRKLWLWHRRYLQVLQEEGCWKKKHGYGRGWATEGVFSAESDSLARL